MFQALVQCRHKFKLSGDVQSILGMHWKFMVPLCRQQSNYYFTVNKKGHPVHDPDFSIPEKSQARKSVALRNPDKATMD